MLCSLLRPSLAQDAPDTDKLPDNAMWLQSVDLKNMVQAYGEPKAAKSYDWKALTLRGTVFGHGVGTHANSQLTIDLKGEALKFLATVGVDDEVGAGKGAVTFTVQVDGKEVLNSGVLHAGDDPKPVAVELKDAKQMVLLATAEKGDNGSAHADWAGAMILLDPDEGERPESVNTAPNDDAYKLPPVAPVDPRPAIHGPRLMGVSPGHPFLFLVPVTGKGPFTFTSDRLPKGLKLDANTGIITGQIETPGTYDFTIGAKGAEGKDVRGFTVICGDHKLALTPPLGWNAWNAFGETVTADKVREQADYLISSGLAARGFQYVIIDDTWQSRRDADGNIGPNKRFGDIRALADYVHSKGLKLGIYSSPNDETCSGYAGSGGHEQQDAAQYASWGIDFLKYDWCVTGSKKEVTADVLKPAYAKMRTVLDKLDRDVVYELSPYGYGNVWEWGADVGANTWFTTSQIRDDWTSIQNDGFSQSDRAKYAGPGHWNNPGLLMLGRQNPTTPRFPHLKPAEQMTQVTLWSLLASPLILGCDLSQLDPNNLYPVTTALLTNQEVLDIDQDALGRTAQRVGGGNQSEVWSRPLLDGTIAVGLFNQALRPQEVTVTWPQIGYGWDKGMSLPVRDVWYRKELGEFADSFTMTVPGHGAALLKVGKPLSPTNQVQGWTKPAYLLSTWTWGDGVHYMYSRNGTEWQSFPRDRVWMKSTLSDKHVGNTSVARGPDGTYHMVWQAGGNDKGIGYSSSTDGLTWTDAQLLPVDEGVLSTGVRDVRQPSVMFDKKSGQFVLLWSAIGLPETEKLRGPRIYAMTTKDFKTFSQPKLFFNPTYNCGDPSLTEANGKYYLIFRDHDRGLMKMTYSSTNDVMGPYYVEADTLPTGKNADDATVIASKDAWYLYYTSRVGQEHSGVLKTHDFKTWQNVTATMALPKSQRAGGILAITETTLQDMLRTAFGRD